MRLLLRGIEDALHVQIHDLLERGFRIRVEFLSPCCAGIGEENINVVRCLLDLSNEPLDLRELGAISWYGDGNGTGTFVRNGIEGGDGLIASLCFAGRDVDLRAACLKESG